MNRLVDKFKRLVQEFDRTKLCCLVNYGSNKIHHGTLIEEAYKIKMCDECYQQLYAESTND